MSVRPSTLAEIQKRIGKTLISASWSPPLGAQPVYLHETATPFVPGPFILWQRVFQAPFWLEGVWVGSRYFPDLLGIQPRLELGGSVQSWPAADSDDLIIGTGPGNFHPIAILVEKPDDVRFTCASYQIPTGRLGSRFDTVVRGWFI